MLIFIILLFAFFFKFPVLSFLDTVMISNLTLEILGHSRRLYPITISTSLIFALIQIPPQINLMKCN